MNCKLIVGLGNPGKKYECTRHNIGFLVAERLVDRLGGSFKKKNSYAQLAEIKRDEGSLIIVRPTTFMNLSGQGVKELVGRYDVFLAKELLVILDDADLEFGRLRFREKGSSGGHQGLESIIEMLGTTTFHRLRIGVGRPREKSAELKDYVLDPFSKEEKKELSSILDRASEACFLWLEKGSQAVMNQYN